MLLDFCFASSIESLEPRIPQCETTLFSPYASKPTCPGITRRGHHLLGRTVPCVGSALVALHAG